MKIIKDNLFFVVFFGALYLAFLWPVILFQKTFIDGDYGAQYFPWTYYYAECLKTGSLPYWTTLMTNGFPLVAEGQVGAYYLWNLISYTLFPFKLAYGWNVPVHILFGGIGFYLYGQKLGLSKDGAALSAALYSFSSAYGGCFYTPGTLWIGSWLPWGLLCLKNFTGGNGRFKFLWVSFAAFCISQQWTAGYPQLALYALLFMACLMLLERQGLPVWACFFAAVVLGCVLALPQIVSTAELARVSVRQGENAAFALWGSVLPPALISLLYPEWGTWLRLSFYIGCLPLLLVFYALTASKHRSVRVYFWLAVIFCLLSLGKYNPPYALAVERFSWTMLRNPSKFLFFTTISLAILAGFGYDRLPPVSRNPSPKPFARIFLPIFFCLALLPPVLGAIFLKPGIALFRDYAKRYATTAFSQKMDAVYPLDHYYEVADRMTRQIGILLSPANYRNWAAVAFLFAASIILWLACRGAMRKNQLKIAIGFLIAVDLTVFGYSLGAGFIGNARNSAPYASALFMNEIKRLQADSKAVMAEWVSEISRESIPPNLNLRYGIAHVGGYSPLLTRRYYELSKDFGFVDASLGRHAYEMAVWEKERPVLDALGVVNVISDKKLDWPDFRLFEIINGRYVYRNAHAAPRVYSTYRWRIIQNSRERLEYLKGGGFDPAREAVVEEGMESGFSEDTPPIETAEIVSGGNEEVIARVYLKENAVVVFRNIFYPRWKVQIDGQQERLIPVNHALSGVFAPKGTHRVRFYYDRSLNRFSEIAAATMAFLLVILNVRQWRAMRRQR